MPRRRRARPIPRFRAAWGAGLQLGSQGRGWGRVGAFALPEIPRQGPPTPGHGAERTSGSGLWVPAGSPPHPARSPSGLSLRLKAAAAAARQREGAGEGRVSEWPAPARQQPARRPPRARVSPCLD